MQALLFFPSIKNPAIQKLLCFLLIPDFILFIYLNVILIKRSSHICMGEYLTEEEREKEQGFLPREEGKYLTITLIL